MTFLFIFKTFLTNPGYLPEWLKTPLTADKQVPHELLRIYNLRFWRANRIYSFEEFVVNDEEDNNIEIDLKLEESKAALITEEGAHRNDVDVEL